MVNYMYCTITVHVKQYNRLVCTAVQDSCKGEFYWLVQVKDYKNIFKTLQVTTNTHQFKF